MDRNRQEEIETPAAWEGLSAAFAALGRAVIALDRDLQVIHASPALDEIQGPGTSQAVVGRHVCELLGVDLFGPDGSLTLALRAGGRWEGWRAHVRREDGTHHLVSLSAAALPGATVHAGDPRLAFLVVLNPAEPDPAPQPGAATTVIALVARSAAMLRTFVLIENLRHSEATVLITGESGTAKQRLARSIHDHSPRSRGPFAVLDVRAIPAERLESDLFGHIGGAFPGANETRVGRFEMASEGTLFLDAIGDVPLPLQVKLLRVLQDGTFERVGEKTPRTSRARVIAATHLDLQAEIRAGRFREDLYARLRVVPIRVPPLRERREDIEPLAQALLARLTSRRRPALQLSPEFLRTLTRHDWPGNVRELENALEHAVAVCPGPTLRPEHLPGRAPGPSTGSAGPPTIGSGTPVPPGSTPESRRARRTTPEEVERLRRVLEDHRWNRGAAARTLGVSRTTLWRRLRDAGLA